MAETGEAADVVREALVDLALALKRLGVNAAGTLAAMSADFEARIQVFVDEEADARREVESCREALGDDDYDAAGPTNDLDAAIERHRQVAELLEEVEQQHASLKSRQQALEGVLADRVGRGAAFLVAKAEQLAIYEAIFLDRELDPTPSAGAPARHQQALAAPAHGPSASGLPKGFCWVRLDEINLDTQLNGVASEADFRKVSYQQMRDGLERLKSEILPVLAASPAAGAEHFRDIDRGYSVDYEHGLLRIYEAFFGQHDFVYFVRRPDGELDLINGRHRVQVAQDLGWEAIPARVKERHG